MFAATAATIVSGAIAERMKLSEEDVETEVDRIVTILDEAIDADDDEYAKNRDGYLEKIFGEGNGILREFDTTEVR